MTIYVLCAKVLPMIAHKIGGPEFVPQTDTAAVVLGHSESRLVGYAMATALDELKIYKEIEIVTTNQLDAPKRNKALVDFIGSSAAYGHSMAINRMPNAQQAVLVNPAEPLSYVEALIRAQLVTKDVIEAEPDTRGHGLAGIAAAAIELAKSPKTGIQTMQRLAEGYSSTNDIIDRVEDGQFPLGVVVAHSMQDVFGFPSIDNLERLAENGITAYFLEDSVHNDFLYRPRLVLNSVGITSPNAQGQLLLPDGATLNTPTTTELK